MNAEIITIGDEILIGQIVDTNSQFIADRLDHHGLRVRKIHSIGDDAQDIVTALDEALNNSDVVIFTGGLGPTKDDITKKTLAKYFGVGMVRSEEVYKQVEALFARLGMEVPEASFSQAEIPQNCTPLKNNHGTAPGMWFDLENKQVVVSLPGVPHEMRELMKQSVLPLLEEKYDLQHNVHKTIHTAGIGESSLMEIIGAWEDSLAEMHLKLAYLPSLGRVRLRLSGRSQDRLDLETKIAQKVEELKNLIPSYITGEDVSDLAEEVGVLLKGAGMTVSTAESCTGGNIAHRLTSIPGSSDYYLGSIVAYSNEVKMSQLNVPPEVLKEHGAVSKQTVEMMAIGAKRAFKTDYALATSGIAGPTGGSDEKPVGTVWIALVGPEEDLWSKEFHFGKLRKENIERSTTTALNRLRISLKKAQVTTN